MNTDFEDQFITETRGHRENMKPSSWITRVVMAQLLYALFLLALPVYLLALGDGWGVIFAAAAMGGPGVVALIGWWGLRKGRLWGWLLTLLADLAMLSILIYALVGDGRHTVDWEVVGMTVVTAAISVTLFIPEVRRSCWQRVETRPVLSS